MVSCCSINMRIFKATELILLLFSVTCWTTAAPTSSPELIDQSQHTSTTQEPLQIGDHYDQRQNGTDNFRLHVDGLVVVVAPVEALLLAGGLPGGTGSDIFAIAPQPGAAIPKPKPQEDATLKPIGKPEIELPAEKPESKSSHRPGLRLMSLLSPFLRRVQPHQ